MKNHLQIKKLTLTALFTAVAVVGSMFSFPVLGSKCAPVQHLVNVLCAVTVGPWWGLAQAFMAALIRNLTGLGSPLAFPGSMCGALLAGFTSMGKSFRLHTWEKCLEPVSSVECFLIRLRI